MAFSSLLRDFCEELDQFHSHFDPIPVNIHTEDFVKCPASRLFRRPACSHSCCEDFNCHTHQCKERSCCPRVSIGKDGVEMTMNVKQFKAEEISVKTLGNTVQIEGKHEEQNDAHGAFSQCFAKRYTLPQGYDPEQVMSTLSAEGVLVVKAPAPAKTPEVAERVVPINREDGRGSPTKQ